MPMLAPESPVLEPAPRAWRDRAIVLVGLMGVGKTTIGRRLAARLKLPFVDADAEIEQAAGASVSEIFARFGEAGFRDGERRVIRRLMAGRRAVIATGGGAFVDPETRELILARGLAIWLDADIDVLVERTSRRDTRPLLRSGDPWQTLSALAEQRRPFYAEAPIHVRSQPGPHTTTVQHVCDKLDHFWSTHDATA